MTQEEIAARLVVLSKHLYDIQLEMADLHRQIREGLPPDPRLAERYRLDSVEPVE